LLLFRIVPKYAIERNHYC